MKRFLFGLLAGLILGGGVLVMGATKDYLNGVWYTFPATQGAAGKVLINDGTGVLSWQTAPTVAELWEGAIVFSLGACPDGFTQLDAGYNGRYFRAAATGGGVGGASSHSHTLSGSCDTQAVTLSGNTGSASLSLSGSTASASISHGHTLTTQYSNCSAGAYTSILSVSVNATDPSHSHGVGTLSPGSHSHGAGTLAASAHTHSAGTLAAASSTVTPPYYGVIACVKD